MARKKKVPESDSSKMQIFAFMGSRTVMRVLSATGSFITAKGVASVAEAKEYAMSTGFYEIIEADFPPGTYRVEWIDEDKLGSDERVIEACRLAETPVEREEPAPILPALEITLDSVKNEKALDVFIRVNEEFVAGVFHDLKADDIFRLWDPDFGHIEHEGCGTFKAIAEPFFEDGVWKIKAGLVIEETFPAAIEEEPVKIKKVPPTHATIDLPISDNEAFEVLSREVCFLQNLKLEASSSAASYNKKIKDQMDCCYKAALEKPLRPTRCEIKYLWEAGIKHYIDPKGAIVKTEDITDVDRQFDYADELLETIPGKQPPETDAVPPEGEDAEAVETSTNSADESDPAESEPVDFEAALRIACEAAKEQ